MTSEYMNNLYRDLLSNSPQTVTIPIPSDMGIGQIAQVVTKQGAVVSDWKMNYFSDMNVRGINSEDYIQMLFCLNDGVSWNIAGSREGACLAKGESCIYRGHGKMESLCYAQNSDFYFKNIKIPVPYFKRLLQDYFEDGEITVYEKKLLTYPRTDSQYLTEDMGQTAQHLVSDLLGLLPFAQGLALTAEVGRVLNSKKVSDHHAIIPTAEFVKQGFAGLAESECKLMNLVCSKLLCAIAAPHEYETVTAVFSCAGNEFTAKGKTVLVPGWKEIDQRFRSTLKADTEEEVLNTLPELAEGQSFSVMANVSEHFTSPPKAYTEDTLLSAMERAGAEDMPEDKVNCSAGAREGGLGQAERKGLGTPATRAAILEKLVQMGFVQRKGKQLVPTKDGINLAVVLPESLTSPALTAEWENRLTEIAKGNADPDEFMAEIEAQVRQLVKTYSCISADKQNLFQSERVIIGKCPRCSENVYEGKKNFYCGNRSCQFVMWKNDRFFEQRKKAFTPKIAAALLKNGKAKVKGLYSEKTGKTYDATVLLADTGGKYVNYRVERKE